MIVVRPWFAWNDVLITHSLYIGNPKISRLMNDGERLLELLQIIRVNGNTEYLLRKGYALSDLVAAIEDLQATGMVMVRQDGIGLTRKGESYFHDLNRRLGRRGLYKYFNMSSVYKGLQISLDTVYVPSYMGAKKEKT